MSNIFDREYNQAILDLLEKGDKVWIKRSPAEESGWYYILSKSSGTTCKFLKENREYSLDLWAQRIENVDVSGERGNKIRTLITLNKLSK
jgi:hypothetical protein